MGSNFFRTCSKIKQFTIFCEIYGYFSSSLFVVGYGIRDPGWKKIQDRSFLFQIVVLEAKCVQDFWFNRQSGGEKRFLLQGNIDIGLAKRLYKDLSDARYIEFVSSYYIFIIM